MTYIKKIKTTLRKTKKHFGELSDVFETKQELKDKDLDFYEDGDLIFVNEESQVYRITKKEITTCEN